MRRLEAEIRVEIGVHLHVSDGTRSARAQLVNVGDSGVLLHQRLDTVAVGLRQFAVHEFAGGFAKNADGSPQQNRRDGRAGQSIQTDHVKEGDRGDADQRNDIGRQVRRIVGPISGHSHRCGLAQQPRLGGQQSDREYDRDDHHRDRPRFICHRLRREQMMNSLLRDQCGRGEHQAGLDQAGEGLGLAVAEPVFRVRRRRRIAHSEESGARRHEIHR